MKSLFRSTASMSAPEKVIRMSLMTGGFMLIAHSAGELAPAFAFDSAKYAIKEICGHMQGNLGALLMSAAGVGAVISGAMGNFRASFTLIIVGVGAFTTDAIMSLFFPDAAEECAKGSEGGGGAGNDGGANGAGNGGGNGGGDVPDLSRLEHVFVPRSYLG